LCAAACARDGADADGVAEAPSDAGAATGGAAACGAVVGFAAAFAAGLAALVDGFAAADGVGALAGAVLAGARVVAAVGAGLPPPSHKKSAPTTMTTPTMTPMVPRPGPASSVGRSLEKSGTPARTSVAGIVGSTAIRSRSLRSSASRDIPLA
jgi:hypothetical protein